MKKQSAKYVDGFVIVIKKDKLAAYKKLARVAEKVWYKHGALDYKECVGDDLNIEWGLPFTKLTKCKEDETVLFSFITYKTKAHRNAVNKKVMADPDMQCDNQEMPFEMKKMAFGGFKVLVG